MHNIVANYANTKMNMGNTQIGANSVESKNVEMV